MEDLPWMPQVMTDTSRTLKAGNAWKGDLVLEQDKGQTKGRKASLTLWDMAVERECSFYSNGSRFPARRNGGGILAARPIDFYWSRVTVSLSLYDRESEGGVRCCRAGFVRPYRTRQTRAAPEAIEFAGGLRSQAGRRDVRQTSNCLCPLTSLSGRISPENCTRRPKRLRNASPSEAWAGTVLLMVAMVVGSCGALPAHQTRPLSARTLPAHQKDWRLCCGRPNNVTVLMTTPTSVLVTWSRPRVQPLKYEITYKPTDAKYRVVAEVVAPQRSVVLERLLPLTQYQVYVTTVVNSTMVWTSPVVTFHTDEASNGNASGHLFSTPTMLGKVEVSLGGLDHKVGLVRVRAEEVGIVLVVLAVWMFAIALFFNRWGKIRMLEPYQEPYKETPPQVLQHRPSCPMADPCAALPVSTHKAEYLGIRRPRQNSVFVGRTRSHSLDVHPPRRVKSALNLTTLVLQESEEEEEEEGAVATTFT